MIGLRHSALFYADPGEFLAGTLPFVRDGLEADEAILVALPARNLALLRGALGSDTDRVGFAEMETLGRNPARIIPAWRAFLDEHLAGDRGVRGIGEPIWAQRSAAEIDECGRHESLLNLAFADDRPFELMCPYDASALDDDALAGAAHNHPVLERDGQTAASAVYRPPHSGAGPFDGELEPPTAPTIEMTFTARELGAVRRLVADEAERAGLLEGRTLDLVLAVSEVATNSARHGGGGGRASVWIDRSAIVCQVQGGGQIEDHLVGRVRPLETALDGRGLWIANQLCDLVQIRSGPRGTVVRLRMDLI